MILNYKIINNKYKTIKDVLTNYFKMSDRLISKLKRYQKILLNNENVYVTALISLNDIITIDLNFSETSDNILPVKMNLNILFEDDSFLILDKPPYLPIHPSCNHYSDSLSNGVKAYFLEKKINTKIRPVNRLDKDTSGIVIFAKNQYVQECLIKQMKTSYFIKEYIAILSSINFPEKEFTINAPISRKPNSIIERQIDNNGETAITNFKIIKTYENYSLVKCLLKTGRTHQIRAHSKYINAPILGDSLYGNSSDLINRQALHCFKMSFIHPITNKKLEISSDIPSDIKSLI